ncbi:unnamed protein product [Blepharisma stoltei]|uniref:Uncharacterized protein n=1 Tax=Blepharisma stoltei TaxID=1481888 RepID=A0AAU9IZB5_9CILI|nr:unnamed protein product [Blepharisma stoltei]
MKANNLSEFLLSRETGSIPSHITTQRFPMRSSWTPKLIFPHMDVTNSVIWIKGRENYTISLNKSGKAVYRTILPLSPPIMLSQPNEHVYKVCLSSKGAFLILKRNNERYLQFFTISDESLKNGSLTRVRVLEKLVIEFRSYEEIDYERQILSVKVGNRYQLWSLESEEIILDYPLPPSTKIRYYKGYLILCSQEERGLKFTVRNIDNSEMYLVRIMGGSNVYHFEVCRNWLVVSMKEHHIQLINLITKETKWIKKGDVTQYYEIDCEDDSLLTFSDGSAVLISNPDIDFTLGSPNSMYVDIEGMLLAFSNDTSAIRVLDLKTSKIINSIEVKKRGEVTCIGLNDETQQIFVGLKSGKICLLD